MQRQLRTLSRVAWHGVAGLDKARQILQRLVHAIDDAGHENPWQRNLPKSHCIELRRRQPGWAAFKLRRHQMHAIEISTHFGQLRNRGQSGDEQPMRSGFQIALGSAHRSAKAFDCVCVAAGDDLEVSAGTRGHGHLELVCHDFRGNNRRGSGIARLLGYQQLVFQHDRTDPEAQIAFDHIGHAFDVPVAIVSIDDQGQIGRRDDVANSRGHLPKGSQTDVWQSVARCKQSGSTNTDGFETGTLDQPGTQRIMRKRRYQGPVGGNQLTNRNFGHGSSYWLR